MRGTSFARRIRKPSDLPSLTNGVAGLRSRGWRWSSALRNPRGAALDFAMFSCPPLKDGRFPRGYHTLFRILVDKEALRREFLANAELMEGLEQGRADSRAGRVHRYEPHAQ